MSEFNENEVFPEQGNIPENETPPEYVTADVDLPDSAENAAGGGEEDTLNQTEPPAGETQTAAQPENRAGEVQPDRADTQPVTGPAAPADNNYSQPSGSYGNTEGQFAPRAPFNQSNPVAPQGQVNSYSPFPGSVPYQNYSGYNPNYNPQPVVTVAAPAAAKTKNKGLIIFAALMAVVILATAVLAIGYFVINGISGRHSLGGAGTTNPTINTELVDRPESAEEGSASYVYGQTVDSVVLIQVYSLVDTSVGSEASGVIYSEDGYIVTNDHIYDDIPDPQFLITTADGRQFDGTFVAGDSRTDMAVLKIEADGLSPATFGDSEQCMVGEDVITIGNPGGSAFTFSMTNGIVSAVDRWASNSSNYSMRFIQIDAPINSGNSGGALVNMYGQVIGITTWKYVGDNFENVGFAVPSSTVVKTCDSLISNGYVADRAKLGFTYRAIDAVTAKINNIQSTGLLVSNITGDTSFAASGVAEGDLITHINGTHITNSITVLEVLEKLHPGDTVTLTFLRSNGTTFEAEVELAEDRGTSSYTLESSGNTNSNLPYGGDFNFPNGD